MIDLKRFLLTLALLLVAPPALAGTAADDEANLVVQSDANLITGIDCSSSINATELTLQIEGIAKAIQSDQVLSAIERGPRRRIGFSVFLWADGEHRLVIPWRTIAGADDAKAVADELMTNLAAITADTPEASLLRARLGSMTDISAAMAFAGDQLRTAPFTTRRPVLNIIGNGEDNVGAEPLATRDALKASGVRINGVVVGADQAVMDYFRRQVSTGFVLPVADADNLVSVFATKFMLDLVMLETR